MNVQMYNKYYVIDLDRCIANTDKLYDLLEHIVISETTLSRDDMKQARLAIENSKGSFNTVDYVVSHLDHENQVPLWSKIKQLFHEKGQKIDMYEPNAQRLLYALEDHNIPYGILTYGGEEWQQMKLQVLHLETTAHIITDRKEKGQIISGWKQQNGTFRLPDDLSNGTTTYAKEVILIDDKTSSFKGLPSGATGIHILPEDGRALLPSQQGDLPDTVMRVAGMGGVLDLLNSENVDLGRPTKHTAH